MTALLKPKLVKMEEEYHHITDATYDDGTVVEELEFWDDVLEEAEYQGRKVTLNKPMKGDVKKSPCMKENFLGASTLSRCYKGLPIVNHNNQMFCELMIIGHHPMVTINADKAYARWLDIITRRSRRA
mgnify:CR=1 FL=1